ncbi:MAG TPA: aspartyl-phosphate phosphatase Spo0E family protein [Bacilli bacterium]|uniref:Aspartyl-phosphate phosphatase Spo0E family protein n=1 Tax=Amphibacillus indicireducens TaxID=1076330 RepID=A0ABP7VP66_9BACI|nr:aspartyl-phosphate phosphatase Spo0E family protein [Bacilli bacterium]
MNVADLLNRIESLRRSMIEVAIDKGFSSNESIEISRELDNLLNQYEKVKSLDT